MPRYSFAYDMFKIDELAITQEVIESTRPNTKPTIIYHAQLADGRVINTTQRFWASLCSRYSTFGINMNLFTSGLFTPKEVFDRLAAKLTGDKHRNRRTIFTRTNDDGTINTMLLGVAPINRGLCKYGDIMHELAHYKQFGEPPAEYCDGSNTQSSGIVRSEHTPSIQDEFTIGRDRYKHRFLLEVPIDGYGKPLIYLALKLVRPGGTELPIVGYAPAFKTEITVGTKEDVTFSIRRALESFGNEDGFNALRNRLEVASTSWASIAEAVSLYKVISAIGTSLKNQGQGSLFFRGEQDEGISDHHMLLKLYTHKVGDLAAMYGLANTDAISRKKCSRLPVQCSLYDLITLAATIAVDYCDAASRWPLLSWIGSIVGSEQEYDLENSMIDYPDFHSFFAKSDGIALATGADEPVEV